MKFHKIEEIIEDFKRGQIVIMVDNEDRENEGDFIMAAEFVTAQTVNFMATNGRGLICMPIHYTIAERLNLKLMVDKKEATNDTPFTVTLDAKNNISSGISASDRAYTMGLIANINSTPEDFVRPGHIFPLIAAKGGLFEREGHTEAAIELAKLSNVVPASILCEILNEDGSVAKGENLMAVSNKFQIKIGSIQDLKNYLKSLG